ncbi:MAG: phage holin family protein [Defluviitaleaceae bacterium]|nr:phage holin family protein [Defluviitaleaceae bacterium]
MKTIWIWAKVGFAIVGGLLSWFLGGMDNFIYGLIAFVVADYITGVMRAFYERILSSRIGAHGIMKKLAIFLIVGVAHLADVYLLFDGNALRTAMIFFYISNEGLSLLENTVAIGLPVPDKLRDALAQLNKKKGNENMDGGKKDEGAN